MSRTEPTHHRHSENEPLPSKALFDYSAKAIQTAKIPTSELSVGPESASRAHKNERGITECSDCDCASRDQASADCTHHCHSALHERQPMAHQPHVKAPEDHHFFNEDNPRPKPVGPEEREQVEWMSGQQKPKVD